MAVASNISLIDTFNSPARAPPPSQNLNKAVKLTLNFRIFSRLRRLLKGLFVNFTKFDH